MIETVQYASWFSAIGFLEALMEAGVEQIAVVKDANGVWQVSYKTKETADEQG